MNFTPLSPYHSKVHVCAALYKFDLVWIYFHDLKVLTVVK